MERNVHNAAPVTKLGGAVADEQMSEVLDRHPALEGPRRRRPSRKGSCPAVTARRQCRRHSARDHSHPLGWLCSSRRPSISAVSEPCRFPWKPTAGLDLPCPVLEGGHLRRAERQPARRDCAPPSAAHIRCRRWRASHRARPLRARQPAHKRLRAGRGGPRVIRNRCQGRGARRLGHPCLGRSVARRDALGPQRQSEFVAEQLVLGAAARVRLAVFEDLPHTFAA